MATVTDLAGNNSRNNVKVIRVTGSHYEVGRQVGEAFKDMINYVVTNYELMKELRNRKETKSGLKIYSDTLAACETFFPEFVSEMRGTADGASVEFADLFLLHLDDMMPPQRELESSQDTGITADRMGMGCTSVMVNRHHNQLMGHTEDAASIFMNRSYLLDARIKRDLTLSRGPLSDDLKDEHFTAFCYPGHLPGFCFGFNQHKLIHTINVIVPLDKATDMNKIPRHFLTRALLCARDIDHALAILNNKQYGTSDGFSINLHSMGSHHMVNIEVMPNLNSQGSLINLHNVPLGQTYFHANSYQHIPSPNPELESLINDSNKRREVFNSVGAVEDRDTLVGFYGAETRAGECHYVFKEQSPTDTQPNGQHIVTLVFGLFDLERKTLTVYTEHPVLKPTSFGVMELN